ncbi:hypothetical protein CIPAW_02G052100 [Carya illinoinensis]|uniref:F-box domain-containing protein n=1 Tax=Carya illinoinensis TaxID=32201 RepID=A0A8T1RB46_CARIL|nr:hypothetical protein CIPAW_02G052100 [Carya illinoinensis]
MGLDSVGDLALNVILTKLGPKETATAACVNKKLRSLASEDSLWFKFCSQDLHLNHPLDPLGNSTPSFKVSYQLWREAFSMYPWLLVMRVNRCWGRLKNWFDINFPEAKATLRKGVSEADIQESERILKVKLPLPTRILYRFCDGQEFTKSLKQRQLYVVLGSPADQSILLWLLLPQMSKSSFS